MVVFDVYCYGVCGIECVKSFCCFGYEIFMLFG